MGWLLWLLADGMLRWKAEFWDIWSSERSWNRTEWQWIFPSALGTWGSPHTRYVYSDTVVVVIVLAEVAARSSVRLLPALLRYLTTVCWETSVQLWRSSYRAGGGRPWGPTARRGCAWEGTRLTDWLSIPGLWAPWLPVISARGSPLFKWVHACPPPMLFTRWRGRCWWCGINLQEGAPCLRLRQLCCDWVACVSRGSCNCGLKVQIQGEQSWRPHTEDGNIGICPLRTSSPPTSSSFCW